MDFWRVNNAICRFEQVNVVNRTLFSRARREFEYCQHWIEKKILHRHGPCKSCGDCPLGVHTDGVKKLFRYAEAKEYVCTFISVIIADRLLS